MEPTTETAKKRVLIIDDNQDILEIYAAAFSGAGYDVKTSANGLIGITDIVDFKPNVVLLDIMMPEMSGYEFLEALKTNTSLRVPVIVFSNLTEREDINKIAATGADLYLRKSDYTGSDLVARVEEFLEKWSLQQTEQPPEVLPTA